MIHLFIGVDDVEIVAYHTMVQSIIDTCTVPIAITPLKLSMLPLYNRERDPKQSNEFSFSRFYVPYLCGYKGHAIFMDLDMLLRSDINELWKLRDNRKSVQVVKHDYTPKTRVKYLGAIQYPYPRKNWSSVMLFNCEHDHCKRLTPKYVNEADALSLHRFHWTHEDYIGSLPKSWNHLVGEYDYDEYANNIHWTIGGPWFAEYSNVDYADEWRTKFDEILYSKQLLRAKEA